MHRAWACLLLLVVVSVSASHSHSHDSSRGKDSWTQQQIELAEVVEGGSEEAESTSPPAPGCSACRLREEMKNYSLEVIKEQILSKLGLEKPPNTTVRPLPAVPSSVLEEYRRGSLAETGMLGDQPPLRDEEDDDFHLRTEKVIVFAHRSNVSHPKLRHNKRRGQELLYFRFSDRITRSSVKKALLWVYVRGAGGLEPAPSVAGAPVNISVLRVLRGWETTDLPHSSTKVPRRNDSEGSWVSLDVRKLLFQVPGDNLVLGIQATGAPDPLGRSLIVTDLTEANGSLVPFLEVFVSEDRRHRAKRSVSFDCQENSEETKCCRYPLTVDFESFGWDWIIAPKKYEANYCSGECPYVFLQKYPHTSLADMARPPGTAGPCCAPRKLSAISMLYFDPHYNIIIGLLPSMVVDKCGCS